jgi:hypothetical protein
MATRRLGIVMYGVTGRMGLNQHLARSIVAIRATRSSIFHAFGNGCRRPVTAVSPKLKAENWWKKPGNEVLRTCVDRFKTAS